MFRIKEVVLYRGTKSKVYSFTDHTYIYGKNNVGKTAFTKVIDFVLGSSEGLSHDGLDHIDEVEAYITNDKTELWIKRTIEGEFQYRRTRRSGYSVVSCETYKDIICDVIITLYERFLGGQFNVYMFLTEYKLLHHFLLFSNKSSECPKHILMEIIVKNTNKKRNMLQREAPYGKIIEK